MAPKKSYSAIAGQPYHYPGGVLVPGQSADLSDEEAARGLASGQIAPTTQAKKAAPAADKESA